MRAGGPAPVAVAVIGLGRSGLPLAVALALGGVPVMGVDRDRRLLAALGARRLPYRDDELAPRLAAVPEGALVLTDSLAEAAHRAEAFVLCLPTTLDDRLLPRQDHLLRLVGRLLRLRRGRPTTVLVRSTVPPGFGRRLLGRLGPHRAALRYAYCPDRSAEGRLFSEAASIPQLVGAADEESAGAARAILEPLGLPFLVTGIPEAELAKLFDNAYRYVNFALAAECLLLAERHGADAAEAWRAASSGYPRGGPWRPGLAAGPCLVKDSFFLLWDAPGAGLLLAAWRRNEGMAETLVDLVQARRPLARPAVLGMAFKADSDDGRVAPGERLARVLRARGLEPRLHDPLLRRPGVTRSLSGALRGATEVFLAVPHAEYLRLDPAELARLVGGEALLVDPWLALGRRLLTPLPAV